MPRPLALLPAALVWALLACSPAISMAQSPTSSGYDETGQAGVLGASGSGAAVPGGAVGAAGSGAASPRGVVGGAAVGSARPHVVVDAGAPVVDPARVAGPASISGPAAGCVSGAASEADDRIVRVAGGFDVVDRGTGRVELDDTTVLTGGRRTIVEVSDAGQEADRVLCCPAPVAESEAGDRVSDVGGHMSVVEAATNAVERDDQVVVVAGRPLVREIADPEETAVRCVCAPTSLATATRASTPIAAPPGMATLTKALLATVALLVLLLVAAARRLALLGSRQRTESLARRWPA